MKFYLWLHYFSELQNSFSPVPLENCFWCYFRQLFISLALRKCKKDLNILNIVLVQDFCPQKSEIAQFPIGFRLKKFNTAHQLSWLICKVTLEHLIFFWTLRFLFFTLLVLALSAVQASWQDHNQYLRPFNLLCVQENISSIAFPEYFFA